MFKARFPKKFALPMMLGLFAMYSCSEKDYYDPNYGGGKNENPLGIEVPDNMDWNLISTINLTVNVDDEYNGEYFYVVEIYDGEPLFSQNAKLLAKGVAKKGQAFTASVETTAGQNVLFIKRTDPRGRSVVGCAELQEGNTDVTYNFASTANGNAAVSRAVASTRAGEVTAPTYDKVPAGAIEVKGSTNDDWFKEGNNYCITGNYRGGINHSGLNQCKLFVSGTWTIPKIATNWNHQIERGLEVIVLPGGKIIDEGEKISFAGTARLTVMPGGRFECDELKFTNTGITYNLGIIKAEEVTLQSNAVLYNDCSILIEDDLEADAANAAIYMNKGSITVGDEINFNNVNIYLKDGCLIKADKINNNYKVIYEASGNTSLVTANEISCGNANRYRGTMVVEAKEHTAFEKYTDYYKIENGANVGKPGDANIVIETCNGESHQPNPGKDPSDPGFPIIVETSTDYIFAMEDQWPYYGDYDMNDVVVAVSPGISNYVGRETTYVKQIKFDVKILAVGALKQIAAAMQLEKIAPDQVESVKYHRQGVPQTVLGNSFSLAANGVETNQEKAVIPFFENANKLLGDNFVNVGRDVEAVPVEFTIDVVFKDNANVKPADLGHKDLNFFIIPDLSKTEAKQRRPEVHLGGYNPTDLANPDLFKMTDAADNGTKKYIGKDGMVWGLMIPTTEWKCPDESVNITEAYPNFAKWVTSGGKENQNWYQGE